MSDKGDITTTEGSAVDHGTEPTTEKSGDGSTITTADQDFLIQCLKNTVGGGIQVDLKAVAEVRGQKSVPAVKNRVLALKKKYNIPLVGRTQNGNSASTEDVSPKTPKSAKSPKEAKSRVTKPRTPSATKKGSKKTAKSKDVVEEEEKIDDEAMGGVENELKAQTKEEQDENAEGENEPDAPLPSLAA